MHKLKTRHMLFAIDCECGWVSEPSRSARAAHMHHGRHAEARGYKRHSILQHRLLFECECTCGYTTSRSENHVIADDRLRTHMERHQAAKRIGGRRYVRPLPTRQSFWGALQAAAEVLDKGAA